MAKKMYEETRIAAVAEKIRELTGTETQYTTGTMPEGVEEVAITGYLAGLTESPLILPHSVSYGTDYIDGIIGDTDALVLEAFTRTPIAGELFFFIAKTKKNDVVGVTAKVLGLFTDAYGVEKVEFSVEDATLFHSGKEIADLQAAVENGGKEIDDLQAAVENGGKEIDDLQETVDSLAIPLHYNYAVTLQYVSFDELFNWRGIPGNPYSNSFFATHFSRPAKLGDVFSLLFTDRNKNKVYAFARVTNPLNDSGNVEFVIEQAMLFHNTEEIAELKANVNSLKTEEWTFLVENEDGSTKTVTKKVYVK